MEKKTDRFGSSAFILVLYPLLGYNVCKLLVGSGNTVVK